MATKSAIAQLVDMGATPAAARAALIACKGDVAEAADKVFSGDYDDVPDEEEADDAPGPSNSNGAYRNPAGHTPSPFPSLASASTNGGKGDNDGVIDLAGSTDDEDDGDAGDGGSGEEYDDDDVEEFSAADEEDVLDGSENGMAADPYAGIEYSKGRVEETIEVETPRITGKMVVAPLPGAKPSAEAGPSTWGRAPEEQPYEILAQGEWMGGCPEKGEQAILFSVYNRLSEGTLQCHSCDHTFRRQASDFFAIFPSFETYKAHLCEILPKTCPNGHQLCFACGGKNGAGHTNGWDKMGGLGEQTKEEQLKAKAAAEAEDVEMSDVNGDGKAKMGAPVTPAASDGESDGKGKGKGKAKEEAPVSTTPPCLFHCSDIQGVMMGVGLFMVNKLYEKNNESKLVQTAKPAVVPKKRGYDDEYYGSSLLASASGFKKGTGYSGNSKEDDTGVKTAEARRKGQDHDLAALLHSIGEFLPRPNRTGGCKQSDFVVDTSTLMHLRRRFSQVACVLLLSNSIMDMSDRSELYLELVEWLLVVGHTEALASMVAMPYMRASKVDRQEPDQHGNTEIHVRYEAVESPREVLEHVVMQSRSILKALRGPDYENNQPKKKKAKKDNGESGEETKTESKEKTGLVDFCMKIVTSATKLDKALLEVKGEQFYKRLQQTLPKSAADYQAPEAAAMVGSSDQEVKEKYEAWAKAVMFDYDDLRVKGDPTRFDHIYDKELKDMEGMTSSRRSIAIAKELAVLSAHLPVSWQSCVFLRADESRPDCMRIMMTGPASSPYDNGAFIFDLALSSDYPNKPPMCKIKSTGGGKYRFNPNLYADGKVCLSLLGTWQGPGWVAGTSTLLQVFLSILSLILGTDDPIANEPSFESFVGTITSKRYNANVRRMTVHVAMRMAIEDPFAPFKTVIHNHFRLKARELRQQLDLWEREDDGQNLMGDSMACRGASDRLPVGGSSGATLKPGKPCDIFKRDLAAVRSYLDDLEAGREITKITN